MSSVGFSWIAGLRRRKLAMPRGPGRILKATVWSWQGLRAAWLHESSFRLECYLLAMLAPLAIWLGEGAIERVLLIGSCLLVLSAELLNSAVEAVIERYGPEFHELAGRAKVSQYHSCGYTFLYAGLQTGL